MRHPRGWRSFQERWEPRVETRTQEKRVNEPVPTLAPASHRRRGTQAARHLAEAWPEVIARLRGAESRLLLLDFDGTLTALRRHPEDVRFSERGKRILRRLARLKNISVAIVSGRKLKTIEKAVGVEGLGYVGLHGAERHEETTVLSGFVRRTLAAALKNARARLKTLRGIEIEDKGLSFAVHYRGARRPNVDAGSRILAEILAGTDNELRVLNGARVWEVLPRDIPGKGAAVVELLEALPGPKVAMYFGDDETDEEAFAALPGQITVKVGSGTNTRAAFHVRNAAEVLHFLSRLEKELS